MKTEFEVASIISNYITSQEGVTDFPVSLKQISDEVDTLRVRVIDDLDSKGLMKKPFFNFVQTIVSATSKDNTLDGSPRYIDVPRLVTLQSGSPAIAYIGGSKTPHSFRIVYGLQSEWHTKDRWIGNLDTAIITEIPTGHRIQFKNVTPSEVKLTAIFQDPSDLESYGYNGWVTYNESGSLYPVPSGTLDVIIGKTVESYIRTMYRTQIQANQQVDSPKLQKDQEPA